jgi:hypothetical protein
MMSEVEAWEYLRELWEGAVVQYTGTVFVLVGDDGRTGRMCDGLCECAAAMYYAGMIGDLTMRQMLARLGDLPGFKEHRFYWPQTSDGARQRAEFCDGQVERCRREESRLVDE